MTTSLTAKQEQARAVKAWVEKLKGSDFRACITGSCLLDADFSTWDELPDVDMFAYSDREMIRMIQALQDQHHLELGVDGSERSYLQEQQKYDWLVEGKNNKYDGTLFSTVKLHDKRYGTIINVSWKKHADNVAKVLGTFDMSIVMKGYDIRGKWMCDFTKVWGPENVAMPNPLKRVDYDLVKTTYWVRQFDRVIKYWQRGYDTRPMAETYIEKIDMLLKRGNIWTSEAGAEFYHKFADELIDMRKKVAAWLEERREDAE